eukprot:scaffold357674_cov18-Prasinocladus_malaysianus.AAC.1
MQWNLPVVTVGLAERCLRIAAVLGAGMRNQRAGIVMALATAGVIARRSCRSVSGANWRKKGQQLQRQLHVSIGGQRQTKEQGREGCLSTDRQAGELVESQGGRRLAAAATTTVMVAAVGIVGIAASDPHTLWYPMAP